MKKNIRFKIQDLRFKNKLVRFSFYLLLVACYLSLVSSVNAQTATSSAKTTPTPTKTTVKEKVDTQINQLKDKIASRVAQLKLVERKGVVGVVTEVSQTQITISDLNGNTKFIDVDELTKFASPSAKESFGISDISKGTNLGILGLYNKQTRRILSRFIDVITMPKKIHGTITAVDKEEFVLTVATDKESILVDVENTTKTMIFDKNGDGVKAGFSKIEPNTKVLVVGYPDKKDSSRLIGSRILLFPDFGSSQPVEQKKASPSASVKKETPTATSSGKSTTTR